MKSNGQLEKTFIFTYYFNKMYCLCVLTSSTFFSLTYVKPYIFRHILTGVTYLPMVT